MTDGGPLGRRSSAAGDDGARTRAGGSGERGAADQPRWPAPPDWDRYRCLGLLGQGGMGVVFLARDLRLDRTVAIKFLVEGSVRVRQRFLTEARAQARIHHENVCEVYETGLVANHPYIAMRHVDGRPLDEAAREMSLEEKLRVVRDTAEGLHAAHRAGLVHRDVKPANILVELTEGGAWHPWLVDFGLARFAESAGLTSTGMVLGTPSYMSPEQARGRSDGIDRRSDVYSLGATLYRLLAGRAPHEGTATEVLSRVLDGEVEPLRKAAPSVPRDVETIVMTCLAEDADRRYASARALARDLTAYLDGESIAAVPPGWSERARRAARRHPAWTAAAAVTLAAVAALAGVVVRAGRVADERARTAERLGRAVEEMSTLMRLARMSPLHDIRSERRLVRERVGELEAMLEGASSAVRGPCHHAIGRGLAELGDHAAAVSHFEQALALGHATAEVRVALGESLGALYARETQRLARVVDPDARRREREAVLRRYREPALDALREGLAGGVAAAEHVEAQVAFHEGRWDDVLVLASRVDARTPWLYEAARLRGDALAARGREAHERGDHAEALADYELARAEYAATVAAAPSDVAGHEALCSVLAQQLYTKIERVEISRPGPARPVPDLDALAEAANEACANAAAVDPTSARAWDVRAHVAWQLGWWRSLEGEDPTRELGQAIAMANRALEVEPGFADALARRARAEYFLGHHAAQRGDDPRPHLERAVASCRRATELDPGLAFGHYLAGAALRYLALVDELEGRDPLPSLEEAEAFSVTAARLSPRWTRVQRELLRAHVELGSARVARGLDASECVRAADAALASFAGWAPEYPALRVLHGRVRLLQARDLARRGLDAAPVLEEAMVSLGGAAGRLPPGYVPLLELARCWMLEARTPGLPPAERELALALARAAYETASVFEAGSRLTERLLERELARAEAECARDV